MTPRAGVLYLRSVPLTLLHVSKKGQSSLHCSLSSLSWLLSHAGGPGSLRFARGAGKACGYCGLSWCVNSVIYPVMSVLIVSLSIAPTFLRMHYELRQPNLHSQRTEKSRLPSVLRARSRGVVPCTIPFLAEPSTNSDILFASSALLARVCSSSADMGANYPRDLSRCPAVLHRRQRPGGIVWSFCIRLGVPWTRVPA